MPSDCLITRFDTFGQLTVDILAVFVDKLPLILYDFSFISSVFMNFHENKIKIICPRMYHPVYYMTFQKSFLSPLKWTFISTKNSLLSRTSL